MDYKTNLNYAGGQLSYEGVSLIDLANRFGTPTYVYSAGAIRDQFAALKAGLAGREHLICYAMKANGNLHLLRLMGSLGAGADIVSGGELYRATRAGIPAERIVFSGVGKTQTELTEALEAGVLLFIVESVAELQALSALATKLGRTARISVRVNPDIDPKTHPYISTGLRENKFGIAHRDAVDVFRLALNLPGIDPAGLGAHIGSQLTSLDPFRDSVRLLSKLAAEVRAIGVDLRYVDVGGGLGIRYSTEVPPDAGQYGALILEHLNVPDTTLILEPGRSLVGNAGILLTRVLYTKPGPQKTFLICDAGMNDLLRPSLYQAHHEVLPVNESEAGRMVPADLVGPVCETGDFLARGRQLPDFSSGSLAVLTSAGAYGFAMSSNYNARPRAAEVLVSGAEMSLIRRRETYADLVACEESLG